MAVILPVSLAAQDAAAAMLQSNGVGVQVNHNNAPASTALFPKDLIETQKSAAARIEITGSTADINAETMVVFDSDELVLDHGSLSVHTSRGLKVRVGCLTVTPVNDAAWTQYDVTDVDGKVTVKASQNDVYINAHSKNPQEIKEPQHSSRTLVRQGEEKSRDEKCGGGYIRPEYPGISATAAALNSPLAVAAGAIIVVGITCYALCRSGNPVSPACPSESSCSIP
jgi:hypothetical protein